VLFRSLRGPCLRPFLVCDLLEGKDLGDVLRERGALPVPLAIRIVRQVCDALEAAHDQGVIHRDLKPENVFLVGSVDEPRTRVLDFGLSRVIEFSEVQMTQTGMIMGTLAYMSFEQARGERGDHRIDVYGAGALLYVCLTGKAPFTEETASATVVAVLTGEPKRPCSLVPSLSPDLELVVQKAMARAAADRYPTMRDFSDALARFDETAIVAVADASPVSRATNAQAPPLPSTAKGVRGRAVWWLLFAVLVGALGLIGAGLGVLELLDRRLTQTEMILALVGVFGSVFTPGLLLLLRIRKEYWNNSAKMVNLVGALRGPVLAGLVVYGLAGLVARGLDGAGKRLLEVTTPNASGWVGWAPFLFGVASVAAIAALLRHKLLSSGKAGLLRRMTAGPVLVTLAAGGTGAILFAGFETMSNSAPDASPAGASAKATATAAPSAPSATAAPAARASAAPSASAKK